MVFVWIAAAAERLRNDTEFLAKKETPFGVSFGSVSKKCRNGMQYMPPLCKGRCRAKARRRGCRRKTYEFALVFGGFETSRCTIPQSAFGPGRNHRLLPALAKNMPPACFLNASRPLHKGALGAIHKYSFFDSLRNSDEHQLIGVFVCPRHPHGATR